MEITLTDLLNEELSNIECVVVPDCGTAHTHTANTGC